MEMTYSDVPSRETAARDSLQLPYLGIYYLIHPMLVVPGLLLANS